MCFFQLVLSVYSYTLLLLSGISPSTNLTLWCNFQRVLPGMPQADLDSTPFGLGELGGLAGLNGLGMGSANFMDLQQRMMQEVKWKVLHSDNYFLLVCLVSNVLQKYIFWLTNLSVWMNIWNIWQVYKILFSIEMMKVVKFLSLNHVLMF